MKRLAALFLLLTLWACPAARAEEDWYLETAEELAACMGELVRDDLYRKQQLLYANSPAVASLISADYQSPVNRWSIPLSDALAGDVLALFGLVGAQSEFGMEPLLLRATTLLISNAIQEDRSMDAMTARDAYSFTRTCRMPEDFVPHYCLLEFDHALLAMAFVPTGGDCVTVTVSPVFVNEGTSGEDVAGMIRNPLSMLDAEEE